MPFGAVLGSAGWLDGLVGGELHVSVAPDDTKPEPPARGKVEMKAYRVQKVPANPARSVANLNGVVDQLSRVGGDRQVFDELTVDVEKEGDRLRLRNGRTAGNNVGVTLQGTVQLNNDEICLAGGIVPAYALNSIISNIPLIGELLTGGRGGGLFALNYLIRGPIDDPSSSVNPLSVLPIGPLRNLMLAGAAAPRRTPPRPPISASATNSNARRRSDLSRGTRPSGLLWVSMVSADRAPAQALDVLNMRGTPMLEHGSRCTLAVVSLAIPTSTVVVHTVAVTENQGFLRVFGRAGAPRKRRTQYSPR